MSKPSRGGGYNRRRIGQLLGCTGMSGYNWLDAKDNISGIVRRLALVMVSAIARDGRDGFDRYLDTVEAEAAARGFAGLGEVFRNEWKSRRDTGGRPAPAKAGRPARKGIQKGGPAAGA